MAVFGEELQHPVDADALLLFLDQQMARGIVFLLAKHEKKRTLLPADKVRATEAEIQGKLQKVQQTYLRHQQELSGKEQEATGKIFERMQRIIGKIASNENLTMVFDRTQAGLIFAKPSLDLTNEVIRRYNSGEGKEAGGTAAKPGAAKPAAPAAPKK